MWLEALGSGDDPRVERGPAFADDFLLIRAAEAGQGIALVRDTYARQEIAAGRLMAAFDCPWPTEFAYYAVTLPGAKDRPVIGRFVEWLAGEAALFDEPG